MVHADAGENFTKLSDNCFTYVTLHMSYIQGGATPAEDGRVVRNALEYIVYGIEESFMNVTAPESMNIRPLKDTLEWAQRHIKDTEVVRERIMRLRGCVQAAERQQSS